MSNQVLNIPKDGDSTTFLGNMLQCFITFRVKSFFMFKWNFPYFNWCPLPLVLSPDTIKKSLDPSCLHQLFIRVDTIPTEPFIPGAKQSQLPQHLLLCQMHQLLNQLSGKFAQLTTVYPCHSCSGNPDLGE